MNTQYHTTTTSPALPVTEELADIPSEHITGRKKRPPLNEFTMSERSMGLFFKMISEYFEHRKPGDGKDSDRGRYYTYGDVDGFTFGVDWGVFHITVERRYQWNVLLSAADEGFRINEVWDTVYDCSRPCQAQRMNDYAKRNKFQPL